MILLVFIWLIYPSGNYWGVDTNLLLYMSFIDVPNEYRVPEIP